MPRVKKTESSEEDKIKKSTKKSTKKDSKRDNPEEEIVEDELSEVDLDETGREGADVKDSHRPKTFETVRPERIVTKLNAEILPPKGTPYEELDIVDHLNCIIKFAGETYNQDLRSDALDLKRRITGTSRRPRSRSKNQSMSRGETHRLKTSGLIPQGETFVRKNDNFNKPESHNNFGRSESHNNFNRPGFNQRDSRPPNFSEPRQFNRSRQRSNSLTQRRPPMMETPDIYND